MAESWRVRVLLELALRAALLPLPLWKIGEALPAYLRHLARPNEKVRPRQIELFLWETRPEPG